jgi:mannose-1-phosphate guanylyltransferase
MLQATVDRLAGLVEPAQTLVVTSEQLVPAVREQLPQLPAEAVLGEPCRRDTAPCVGLAAALIARRDPQATMLVLPADHAIETVEAFQRALRHAVALVEDSPARLVTFGIPPTYAATTFGYIERGERIAGEGEAPAEPPAQSARREPRPPRDEGPLPTYCVARFREKPDAATAQQYFAAGTFSWNAGIFVWRAQAILDLLAGLQPELHRRVQMIAAVWAKPDFAATLAREFAAIRPISIDYAVMEHAPDVAVVEAPFAWNDVGSWRALATLAGEDAAGNTIQGRHLGIDTRGSIVRTTDDHLVATLGVEDLIVVHTPDATLVARRGDEESLLTLVKLLKERGWTEHL